MNCYFILAPKLCQQFLNFSLIAFFSYRLTLRLGKPCLDRICRMRRPQMADPDYREQAGSTAWVTRLQEATGPKPPKNSRQMPPPPINKVSGAPPSNTLWNTVPNLSRHIEEASCNAVYGNQEMDRLHYNFAVSRFELSCTNSIFIRCLCVPGTASNESGVGRWCTCRDNSKRQTSWRVVLPLRFSRTS